MMRAGLSQGGPVPNAFNFGNRLGEPKFLIDRDGYRRGVRVGAGGGGNGYRVSAGGRSAAGVSCWAPGAGYQDGHGNGQREQSQDDAQLGLSPSQ